jgi:hypothetical protein
MRIKPFLGFLVLAVSSAQAFAQTLTIDHGAVGCAVAEKFPKLDARFSPADSEATARVVFQPEKNEHWWSVAMTPEGNSYVGILPKPQKSLKAFRYYVEVTGKAMGTARTPEHTAAVVPRAADAKGSSCPARSAPHPSSSRARPEWRRFPRASPPRAWSREPPPRVPRVRARRRRAAAGWERV